MIIIRKALWKRTRVAQVWLSGGPSVSHRGHRWRHIESTLNEYASSYPQYDTEAWESIENHTSTLHHRKMFVFIYWCFISKQGHNVFGFSNKDLKIKQILSSQTHQPRTRTNQIHGDHGGIWIHSLSGVDASCLEGAGGGGQLHNSPLYHKTNTESPELWRETWRPGGNTERPQVWESNPWSSHCGAAVHQTTAPL